MKESFLIYNLVERKFYQIHFDNCWVLSGNCHNDYIEIEYQDDQIPERIDHNKYPSKKITKPTNLQFKFSELKWADIASLKQVNGLNQNAVIHKLQPVDNGWKYFKGNFQKQQRYLSGN